MSFHAAVKRKGGTSWHTSKPCQIKAQIKAVLWSKPLAKTVQGEATFLLFGRGRESGYGAVWSFCVVTVVLFWGDFFFASSVASVTEAAFDAMRD